MLHIPKSFNDWVNEKDDDQDDSDDLDIDLDFIGTHDDEDDDEEELDERRIRLTKRARKINTVKSEAIKSITGEGSPVRPQIQKIFKAFQKEVKKKAKEMKVSPGLVDVNKITIRRK